MYDNSLELKLDNAKISYVRNTSIKIENKLKSN